VGDASKHHHLERIAADTPTLLGVRGPGEYGLPVAPRPRWWHQLQASKNEALLAVDLYNRSGAERQLEAFIVHMSMAWLKLLQANFERDGKDTHIRDRRGRRQRTSGGDWATKSINLHFFILLRNKIEHRFERDIAALVSGKTQSYLLNYERFLSETFGTTEGLANLLRFPLFISSITDDAVEALKAVRRRVPKAILEFVQDYELALDPGVTSDQTYEFRVHLMPQSGPGQALMSR